MCNLTLSIDENAAKTQNCTNSTESQNAQSRTKARFIIALSAAVKNHSSPDVDFLQPAGPETSSKHDWMTPEKEAREGGFVVLDWATQNKIKARSYSYTTRFLFYFLRRCSQKVQGGED